MNKTIITLAVVAAIGAGTATGWWLGRQGQHNQQPATSGTQERQVLYWYDPMKPDAHFDQPGKSPFMDMDLVPRYADEDGAASSGIKIDPVILQNTGVKYATVTKSTLNNEINISGSVVFNDREVAMVQARTSGIVERSYPLAVGDVVRAGAPLVDVRVPEWFSAQSEYLALRQNAALAGAAKSRLLQLGMTASQIDTVSKTGKPMAVITVVAPRSGMIAELDVRQGMTLAAGQPLARINGLDTVWIEAEVPESHAAQLNVGESVNATLAAWPNEVITGKISSLVPALNIETRTLRVRAEVANKDARFRPGMYAQIQLNPTSGQAPILVVPSEAVIMTGKRNVVIVANEEGRFSPAQVTIGREANNQTEIISGLHEGERVVVSGQFMIDSEASLRGTLARLSHQDATEQHANAPALIHEGFGIVKSVASDEVTLSHDPIPALKWPEMTMPFELAQEGIADTFKAGDHVKFTFIQTGDGPIIQSLTRKDGVNP